MDDVGQTGHVSDPADAARRILEANRYVVLATVDAQGEPWATPVWFAHRRPRRPAVGVAAGIAATRRRWPRSRGWR